MIPAARLYRNVDIGMEHNFAASSVVSSIGAMLSLLVLVSVKSGQADSPAVG